ncbi:MAG: LysM peptidoglycan-binding domain-containing protein, partial [Chlamydiota bacterium]
MSRRDTIIIAVLVNAGILLVLFALAMPSKEHPAKLVTAALETSETSVQSETNLTEMASDKTVPMDEIDQVLSEWNEQSQAAPKSTEMLVEASSITYPLEVPEVATAATETVETKSDKTVEVVVKKGDALDKIARANGTTAQEIMKLNHISSTKLQIGQVLLVPETGKAKVKAKAKIAKGKTDVKSEVKGDLYTVK